MIRFLFVKLRKEVKDMPIVIEIEKDPYYVMGVEKGIEKGTLIEAQELVIEALEERFGFVPTYLKEMIKSINDRLYLKELHRYAIRASSIEEFETRYLQQENKKAGSSHTPCLFKIFFILPSSLSSISVSHLVFVSC